MRVKTGAVKTEAVLFEPFCFEPMLQCAAQLQRRGFAHLARDPGGNVIHARKDPEVAGDPFQKLNLHQRTAAGNEVTGGDHQVVRGNRRKKLRAERIARAGCQHHVRRLVFMLGRDQLPVFAVAGSRNPRHALLVQFDAAAPGSLQQQSIQRQAREDRDRVPQVQTYPAPRRTDQLALFDRIAFAAGIRQERISLQSFVRESAAARLFPGKRFVKENDVSALRRQPGTGQSASRTASDNRNGALRPHILITDFSAQETGSPASSCTPPLRWRSSPRAGVS